jgi:hypothetical protein
VGRSLSDERTGLLFARATVSSNESVVSMYNLQFESEFYITTDSQSASLSWNKAHIWGL